MTRPRFFNHRLFFWPLVALMVGLVLTAALVQQTRQWVDKRLTAAIEHDAHQLAARMQQQFALQEEALRGLVGLFAASDEVSRRDFRAHIETLRLRERFPAVEEFRFARRVTAAELPAWQRQVARSLAELGEPVPDLSPKPPGPRGEYFLVEYVAPFSAASLGLDLLASSPRRAAIGRLRAGQGVALSERLGDEYADFPAYALLAALPPKGNTPLPGTVALIFRPDRLVGELAREAKDYDIELYDAPPTAALGTNVPPIFDTHGENEAPHAGRSGFHQARLPLAVGDRQWTLVVTALPAWPLAQPYFWAPWAVGTVGLLLSLLTATLMLILSRRRQRAESRYRQLVEHLPVAIYEADTAGHTRYVSPQIEALTGWPAEAWRLRPELWPELLHEEDRARVLAESQAALREGRRWVGEYRLVRRDGRVIWVHDEAEAVNGTILGAAFDITREKAAEEALRKLNAELEARVAERTARLSAVLDNLLDAVIVIDEHGLIQSANPALERLLGYAPEEVPGQNVSLLMPEPHRSAHDGYLARYLATGEARIIGIGREVEALHKSGERVAMELAVSEYRLGDQRYFVGVLHDIRAYKRLLAEKERLLAERQEFLATMSHEIRTPLTGILGMLELLSLTPLDADQRHELAIARESGKALSRIIDDILDYSKIEAGRLTLSPEPENLKALIESVRDAYLATASAKGLSLMSFVDPRLPAAVLVGLAICKRLAEVMGGAIGVEKIPVVYRSFCKFRFAPLAGSGAAAGLTP
jgi:PAS domain S-box-containing protein